MYRKCGVSWHGPNKRRQIEIGKDVLNFFSDEHRDIEIEFDDKTHYSHLPDSFFTTCKHLRTAYTPETKSPNQLHDWIFQNNIKKVKLEVIEKHIKFKLVKLE